MKISNKNLIKPIFETDFQIKEPFDGVLIIGNGFDKSLGLKTGYVDFLESEHYDKLLKEENKFAKHLLKKKGLSNWIDIELALAEYSKLIAHSDVNFENEFYSLSNQLKIYLNSVDIKKINRKGIAYNLIKDIVNFRTLIIDFNYTETTTEIIEELKCDKEQVKHVKVHGTLKNDDIIFGVDDKAEVLSKHIFLKKSVHKNYSAINFSKYLAEAQSIGIFGHSLGETDHMYFADFFRQTISETSKMANKDISIYHYNEQGRLNLHSQLDKLTHKSIAKFKQSNEVEFFNTEE